MNIALIYVCGMRCGHMYVVCGMRMWYVFPDATHTTSTV